MKSKMQEIVALILVVLALLIPPWEIAFVVGGVAIYETQWALIFVGPSYEGGRIDVVLLLVEMLVIAGIYSLL